jgi:hypothetical protein
MARLPGEMPPFYVPGAVRVGSTDTPPLPATHVAVGNPWQNRGLCQQRCCTAVTCSDFVSHQRWVRLLVRGPDAPPPLRRPHTSTLFDFSLECRYREPDRLPNSDLHLPSR